jgi:hypothetical protein
MKLILKNQKTECGLSSYFSGQNLVLGFSGHANERTYFLDGKGIYLSASSLTAFKNSDPEILQINQPVNSWWTGTQLLNDTVTFKITNRLTIFTITFISQNNAHCSGNQQ